MARVMLDGCLEKVANNRFDLVLVAAKRAHQLSSGEYKTNLTVGRDKPSVVSLREIEQGLVTQNILQQEYDLMVDKPLTPEEQVQKEARDKEIEQELAEQAQDGIEEDSDTNEKKTD